MQRQIITTRDGSHSISIPEMKVTYHSIHGAIQESMHVFIRTGLHFIKDVFTEGPLRILEVGFGTGLNAWLTLQEAALLQRKVHYTALELFPLENPQAAELNYTNEQEFVQLHTCAWESDEAITPFFTLHKKQQSVLDFSAAPAFQVIYFDAFAPSAQPELWTEKVFAALYACLEPGGILVTYCSKSVVRRAMMAAGFKVQKPPGPFGKREMVRAFKLPQKNDGLN